MFDVGTNQYEILNQSSLWGGLTWLGKAQKELGNPLMSLSRLTKAEKDETQFPMK